MAKWKTNIKKHYKLSRDPMTSFSSRFYDSATIHEMMKFLLSRVGDKEVWNHVIVSYNLTWKIII